MQQEAKLAEGEGSLKDRKQEPEQAECPPEWEVGATLSDAALILALTRPSAQQMLAESLRWTWGSNP